VEAVGERVGVGIGRRQERGGVREEPPLLHGDGDGARGAVRHVAPVPVVEGAPPQPCTTHRHDGAGT
jgi:hypothetical protein